MIIDPLTPMYRNGRISIKFKTSKQLFHPLITLRTTPELPTKHFLELMIQNRSQAVSITGMLRITPGKQSADI